MNLINTIINSALDLVFPIHCTVCGRSGTDLCINCLVDFPAAERECARWIVPLYDYRHPPVKDVVWKLKYKGKKNLAKIFAEILYERIVEELSDLSVMENFRDPLLIPIPLSSARYRERGFNQAELICKELIKINNLRYSVDMKLEKNILEKIKDTGHQARIENRSVRLKNVIGSFAVNNPQVVKDRNIILIDDVTTTGATLSEAKKVLEAAGARKVIAFTFAH